MKLLDIQQAVKGVKYLPPQYGSLLYDFVRRTKPSECLELGFAHGVSVCYMAAALDEIGEGHVTAVDLQRGMEWQKPSIEELLEKTGLTKYVSVYRENLSYTWFLKKKIEEQTRNYKCQPLYDFCYVDGPKNWTNDGLAFFLVDKLLKDGGHILFDDFDWAYESSGDWGAKKLEECGILVSQMADDEKQTPHVEAIFKLLIMQHPDYSDFVVESDKWAWARKTLGQTEKTITIKENYSFNQAIKKRVRRLYGSWQKQRKSRRAAA